jgi:spermidine/putrescine transport system permease protein
MAPGTARLSLAWHRSPTLKGWALLAPTLVLLLALLLLPIVLLLAQSFWTQTGLTMDRSPTLANYIRLAGEEGQLYRMLLLKSLKISLISALVVLLLAFPVAYYIAFHVRRSRLTWLLLITVPFWISYLLRIFSWKIVLGFGGALNSGLMSLGLIEAPVEALMYNQAAVILTLAHSWSAFAVLPIYVALQKIDPHLLEASADLGDGTGRRLFRIILPLSMPGLIAAFLLVFVPTMGDYITPSLVGGTDGVMVGNAIATLFGKQNDAPLGAALAVVTMGAVSLCVLALLAGLRALGLWRRGM